MSIEVHNMEQGTQEWYEARLGLITASVAKQLLTATYKVSKDKKNDLLAMELASERITGRRIETYITRDMERGHREEVIARNIYCTHYKSVVEAGFITTDRLGFKVGYSPDGLVGDRGIIEIKSRLPKFQIQTIVEGEVPSEYVVQCQMGMWVAEREFCDFIQYSNGLPMFVKRVEPDPVIVEALEEALSLFEEKIVGYQKKFADMSEEFIQVPYVGDESGEVEL